MTRRYVVFTAKDGLYYVAGEYNGDKAEYAQKEKLFGASQDGCDKDWKEIEAEFCACKTLSAFMRTVARVNGYYHSGTSSAAAAASQVRIHEPKTPIFEPEFFPGADEVIFLGEEPNLAFWSEGEDFAFDTRNRGLTFYALEEFLVCHDKAPEEFDTSTVGLFSDLDAARTAFKKRIDVLYDEDGILREWSDECSGEQKFQDDAYTYWRDTEGDGDMYRLQIKPIRLSLSEDVFVAIGQAYRNNILVEDFKSQLAQNDSLDEHGEIPESYIQKALADPDLSDSISYALNCNDSYIETYWLTLEEVAREKFVPKKAVVSVDAETTARIKHLLDHEPKDESECFGEDESISISHTFDDGYWMCIDLCGVQYEEGGCNTPWTQAVLYDPSGRQIGFTESAEEFFGKWELKAPYGRWYCVDVRSTD